MILSFSITGNHYSPVIKNFAGRMRHHYQHESPRSPSALAALWASYQIGQGLLLIFSSASLIIIFMRFTVPAGAAARGLQRQDRTFA